MYRYLKLDPTFKQTLKCFKYATNTSRAGNNTKYHALF